MNNIVITNGSYYVRKNNNKIGGKIYKTNDINKAFFYLTIQGAEKDIKNATSKLHNYSIKIISDDAINSQPKKTKCKRIHFSLSTRQAIYHNANCRCQICGKLITYEEFTVDHIIPLANGGTNDMSNLQSACLQCNKIKADILPDDFMNKINDITLYQLQNNYDKNIAKSIVKVYFKNIFKKHLTE